VQPHTNPTAPPLSQDGKQKKSQRAFVSPPPPAASQGDTMLDETTRLVLTKSQAMIRLLGPSFKLGVATLSLAAPDDPPELRLLLSRSLAQATQAHTGMDFRDQRVIVIVIVIGMGQRVAIRLPITSAGRHMGLFPASLSTRLLLLCSAIPTRTMYTKPSRSGLSK
jgi:hypothetical protein